MKRPRGLFLPGVLRVNTGMWSDLLDSCAHCPAKLIISVDCFILSIYLRALSSFDGLAAAAAQHQRCGSSWWTAVASGARAPSARLTGRALSLSPRWPRLLPVRRPLS